MPRRSEEWSCAKTQRNSTDSEMPFAPFALLALAPSALLAPLAPLAPQAAAQEAGWPVHGGVGNIRYSALTQINKSNVSQLKVAWTYDSQDSFKGSEMQSNPIVVGGGLYATTPTLKVVAVDAA